MKMKEFGIFLFKRKSLADLALVLFEKAAILEPSSSLLFPYHHLVPFGFQQGLVKRTVRKIVQENSGVLIRLDMRLQGLTTADRECWALTPTNTPM